MNDLVSYEYGQTALSGNTLELFKKLDQLFLRWATVWHAIEYQFPAFISANVLNKLDYFHSFPHLLTFPVALDADEKNLKAFCKTNFTGEIEYTKLAPVRDVLTPATCYHFYPLFEGRSLDQPAYLTACSACFRREVSYEPLRRQWNFSMREIVCIGSMDEVKQFLESMRKQVSDFFQQQNLMIEWKEATDPFFSPESNPKYLAQLLDPVKTEMIYGGDLSIGSINFHRNYFGDVFRITRDHKEAFSGCVAFGLQRWIYAIRKQFGSEPSRWPL